MQTQQSTYGKPRSLFSSGWDNWMRISSTNIDSVNLLTLDSKVIQVPQLIFLYNVLHKIISQFMVNW